MLIINLYIYIYIYENQYVQNMKSQPQNHNYHRQVHVLREEKGLRVDKVQPISKENFEVVEKIKTCNKLLN